MKKRGIVIGGIIVIAGTNRPDILDPALPVQLVQEAGIIIRITALQHLQMAMWYMLQRSVT